MSLAKVNGLFRLTRDAELRFSTSGSEIVKFGLVSSEKYKDKETTLFLDAVCFGKIGKVIHDYAGQKGNQIYLNGKLQTDQWEDQQGQKRSKVSMVIEGFDFVSQRQQSEMNMQPQQTPIVQENNNGHQQTYSQSQQTGETTTDGQPIYQSDMDEDEIPFAPIGLQYPLFIHSI